MLASTWPMKAPMHTVPTTNQRYEGSRATARSGGGSRPLSTASRSAASEAGPGEESVTSGLGLGSATSPAFASQKLILRRLDRSREARSGETFSQQ